MPPSVVQGVRDNANILQAKRVIDMADEIALLEPDMEPFTAFLKIAKKNTKVANSPKFEWLEDELQPRWDAINAGAGYAAGITALVVDNAVYFSINDIVKVPRTGEVLLVTALNTGTQTLTVTRGYGLTAAAALVDNDPLVIIGNVNIEGGTMREMRSTQEVGKFNYTQIFKTTFGVTNTQDASTMYGGNDLGYQRRKKGVEHRIDMARAFTFGERKEDTTTTPGKVQRATGGLLSFCNKNNYDAAGLLTQSEFDNAFSEVIFKFGSKTKLVLASARMLSVLNGWALSKLQVDLEAQKFGLTIYTYITPFGTYKFMNYQNVLEGAVYGGHSIILDPENVRYRPLKGRDTKLETNIQANDADGRVDQYITEAGLELRNPETHAVLTGVTS